MSEKFYSDLAFILITLIVTGILGYLAGWLKKSAKIKSLKDSLDTCYKANEVLKKEFFSKENDDERFESSHNSPIKKVTFDGSMASLALGKKIIENDLQLIEGIGPKIEELLKRSNIKTWSDLANSSVTKLQDVLKSGGDRFQLHKPHTWPKQATLAVTGKWSELKQLQDILDGGN